MAEDCPVCEESFEAAEESAAREVARHIVEQSRQDAPHRDWIDRNTELGNVTEIAEEIGG